MSNDDSKLAIGKRNEWAIWAWLIRDGFDVYPSVVDDKGIDGIVGYKGTYFEIQIKSGKNWSSQRGISKETLESSKERIYLIFNYTEDEVLYFTADEILHEKEWKESIRWKFSQIRLNTAMREKYKDHDWNGLVQYLRKPHR
ncbi:hypothetical protein FACS189441_4580 [Betaproteobacteria bacterium]|nr:hypothetical protein FACS189441_4580 [Betaproteobacteria bacterium]